MLKSLQQRKKHTLKIEIVGQDTEILEPRALRQSLCKAGVQPLWEREADPR